MYLIHSESLVYHRAGINKVTFFVWVLLALDAFPYLFILFAMYLPQAALFGSKSWSKHKAIKGRQNTKWRKTKCQFCCCLPALTSMSGNSLDY
jgi:hypothetical protein